MSRAPKDILKFGEEEETEQLMQILHSGYPLHPKTLGDQIRKSRLDAGMLIKDLASMLGVTADTIINWEIRNTHPMKQNMYHVDAFITKNNLLLTLLKVL